MTFETVGAAVVQHAGGAADHQFDGLYIRIRSRCACVELSNASASLAEPSVWRNWSGNCVVRAVTLWFHGEILDLFFE